MNAAEEPVWDGRLGTAGGPAFGKGLALAATERDVAHATLAESVGLETDAFAAVLAGEARVGISALARLAQALRLRPIEFLQKTAILSLEAYAFGLDPLYFLPEGQIRYDARIYMREINPRHAVPEGDMIKRNPTLKALVETEPESWPAFLGRPTGPTTVIDADIATVSGAADKVLRVAAEEPYLLRANESPIFESLEQQLWLGTLGAPIGFITYDDPPSTARKVKYVIGDRDLGGIFMWDISGDYDGHSQDLLDAMYDEFVKVKQ